jgi:hypothetical protein
MIIPVLEKETALNGCEAVPSIISFKYMAYRGRCGKWRSTQKWRIAVAIILEVT